MTMMTRYVVKVGEHWITALYDPQSSIGLTDKHEDASSWVTYERAVEAARAVADSFAGPILVQSIVEPAYPASWR